jgi:hypothetical protein
MKDYFCAVETVWLMINLRLEFVEKLQRLRPLLCDRMDTDHGLVDHLISDGIMTIHDADAVRAEATLSARNGRILDYVIEACNDVTKQTAFMTSLDKTRQCHLVNYIESDGSKLTEVILIRFVGSVIRFFEGGIIFVQLG